MVPAHVLPSPTGIWWSRPGTAWPTRRRSPPGGRSARPAWPLRAVRARSGRRRRCRSARSSGPSAAARRGRGRRSPPPAPPARGRGAPRTWSVACTASGRGAGRRRGRRSRAATVPAGLRSRARAERKTVAGSVPWSPTRSAATRDDVALPGRSGEMVAPAEAGPALPIVDAEAGSWPFVRFSQVRGKERTGIPPRWPLRRRPSNDARALRLPEVSHALRFPPTRRRRAGCAPGPRRRSDAVGRRRRRGGGRLEPCRSPTRRAMSPGPAQRRRSPGPTSSPPASRHQNDFISLSMKLAKGDDLSGIDGQRLLRWAIGAHESAVARLHRAAEAGRQRLRRGASCSSRAATRSPAPAPSAASTASTGCTWPAIPARCVGSPASFQWAAQRSVAPAERRAHLPTPVTDSAPDDGLGKAVVPSPVVGLLGHRLRRQGLQLRRRPQAGRNDIGRQPDRRHRGRPPRHRLLDDGLAGHRDRLRARPLRQPVRRRPEAGREGRQPVGHEHRRRLLDLHQQGPDVRLRRRQQGPRRRRRP